MSGWAIVLTVVGFLLALCLAVILMLLFSRIAITLDTGRRHIRVRWFAFIDFCQPLPGSQEGASLRVLGRRLSFQRFRRKASSGKLKKTSDESRRTPVFFRRAFADSAIRRTVASQVARLLRSGLRSFSITQCAANVSAPDPAYNGMFTGVLAATGAQRACGMRVNFHGENNLTFEVSLYPHRLARSFVGFLAGLPYRALFRVWRSVPRAPFEARQ